MKASQKDFAGLAKRAAGQCGTFFFCGPDEAGAAVAAQRIVDLLDSPGERVELTGAQLRADPVLLGDEARSASLFGGTRHIWVRVAGDEAHDAIENHLTGTGDACAVIVVATGASDKSRTAKLLEKREDALVAMFYPPDLASVTASVRSMADAAGLRLNGDLAERIARAAGLDVRLAQSEIDKLALYLDADPQAPRSASAEDLEAIGAATEEDGFMPLVNAVLSGEVNKLDGELKRMRTLALSSVGVLLAFERRTAQLAQIAARIGPRGSLGDLGRGEKAQLGIFWKEERDIRAQMQRWNGARLERLVPRMIELHRQLLANSQSAETLLAQGLTDIARFARGAAKR